MPIFLKHPSNYFQSVSYIREKLDLKMFSKRLKSVLVLQLLLKMFSKRLKSVLVLQLLLCNFYFLLCNLISAVSSLHFLAIDLIANSYVSSNLVCCMIVGPIRVTRTHFCVTFFDFCSKVTLLYVNGGTL